MLIIHRNLLHDASWGQVLICFWSGLRLDLSIISYTFIIPILALFFYVNSQNKTIKKSIIWGLIFYIFSIIFVCSAMIASEIATYFEWKSKLQFKALVHLMHPSEVLRTSTNNTTIVFLIVYFTMLIVGGMMFKNWITTIKEKWQNSNTSSYLKPLTILILSGLMMRGGWQQVPLQLSDAYYSKNLFLNDVAVNTPWGLISSYINNQKAMLSNVYKTMDDAEARVLFQSMNRTQNNTKALSVLDCKQPNVVVFVLEGWSSDVMKTMSGDTTLAPFLDSLSREGIRFDNTYATGWTSDQGIASIVAAQPAFEVATINSNPDKLRKIPAFGDLIPSNYTSSFVFGGDLDYANIKGFLYEQKIDVVIDEDNIKGLVRGKLGIHDGVLLPHYITHIDSLKPPFYTHFFTQSTHSPYDYPNSSINNVTDKNEALYLNAVTYSDAAFKIFFEQAQSKPWFSNTLFVFISDHSHATHRNYPVGDSRNHRIVNFWASTCISTSYRGYVDSCIHSQNDGLATLLYQLKKENDSLAFSTNVLVDKVMETFAPITFHGLHGWVSSQCSYMKTSDGVYIHQSKDTTCFTNGNAFFQVAFDEYLK
jgi:phosphoglycerol transferase MdoB-like AlkP superfamily enzyme